MTQHLENAENCRTGTRKKGSTGPHAIAAREWIDPADFGRLLHMDVVAAHEGTAVLTMPFLIDFAQGDGLMHGGALVSLADTATVMAIKSLMAPGTRFATTRLETRFLRPVREGIVTARARVTSRRGGRLYGRATVYDSANRVAVEFRAGFKITGTNRDGNPSLKGS